MKKTTAPKEVIIYPDIKRMKDYQLNLVNVMLSLNKHDQTNQAKLMNEIKNVEVWIKDQINTFTFYKDCGL